LVKDTVEGILLGRHALLQRSIRAGVLRSFADVLDDRKPELVVLGRPFVGPFLDQALAASPTVVVDADESLPRVAWGITRSRYATLPQRIRAWIEAVAVLGRMERSSYPRATQIWVSSDPELAWFARFVPRQKIRVIPNVVDVPTTPLGANPVSSVAFVGSYFYPPNEAAAFELISSIGPAIRARGGPRRLVLIGPSASSTLRAAAAKDPYVELLGEVPDVRVPLRAAGVLAVPIRAGGGTRVKILEAMAGGVPVVSTRLGVEGLEVTHGRQVLLAETADEFAGEIVRLAADEHLRSRLVREGSAFVGSRHTMSTLRNTVAAATGMGHEGGANHA
jgi:glycosyltransferase involved in cell wall biosynthesis